MLVVLVSLLLVVVVVVVVVIVVVVVVVVVPLGWFIYGEHAELRRVAAEPGDPMAYTII